MLCGKVGEVAFRVGEIEFDSPAAVDEVTGSDEDVASIVAFAAEGSGVGGRRKKLRDDVGDDESGRVHECFRGDAAGEGRIFDCAHLIGSDEHLASLSSLAMNASG